MTDLQILNGFALSGPTCVVGRLRPLDRAVVGVIAASARPVSREYVIDLIWPRSTVEASKRLHSLAQCLYRISKGAPDLIIKDSDKALDLGPNTTADVRTLQAPRSRAQQALAIRTPIDVLRGLSISSPEFEPWRDRTTAELRTVSYHAIRSWVRSAALAGDYHAVLEVGPNCALHMPMCGEIALALFEAALAIHGERGAINALRERLDPSWPHTLDAIDAIDAVRRKLPSAVIRDILHKKVQQTPLMGREVELDSLVHAMSRSVPATTVHLVGEHGIGKSRLIQEATRRVKQQARRVLRVRCYPTQSRLVHAALADLLRSNLSTDDWSNIQTAEAHVISDLTGSKQASPSSRRAPTEYEVASRSAAIASAVRNVIAAMAHSSRVVICIDDAQWLDLASANVLARLMRADVTAIACMVVAERQEDSGTGAAELLLREIDCLDRTVIRLQPLVGKARQSFAEQVSKHLSAGVPLLIDKEGCGNPLLMEELAVAATAGHGVLTLPKSARAVVDSRLHELTTLERSVLDIVAVAGRPVSRIATASVGKHEDLAVQVAVKELERRGLLREARDGSGFEPSNSIVAQRCREQLPPSMEQYVHHRLAQVAAREGLANAVIADHLLRAGAGSSAVRTCVLAARESLNAGAYETALYFLESAARAAHGTKRFERVVRLYCERLLSVGRLERAHTILSEYPDNRLRRLKSYVSLLQNLNRGDQSTDRLLEECLQLYRTALTWARSASIYADIVATTAELAAYSNRPAILLEALATLVDLANRDKNSLRAVGHLSVASRLACLSNGAIDPVALADTGYSRARKCEDPLVGLRALLSQASATWWAGRLRPGRKLYDEALRRCTDPGLAFFKWRVDVERWALMIDMGHAGSACRELAITLTGCSERERIYALANLGAAAFEVADSDLLVEAGRGLEDLNEQLGAPWVEAVGLSYLGYADLLRGDVACASERTRRIEGILTRNRGLALNEPSYVLLFCSRALEEQQGADIAHSWLKATQPTLAAAASFTSKLRIDLESSRLAPRGIPKVSQISELKEAAEAASAAGLSSAASWLQRQIGRGGNTGWRRFVESTRIRE